MKLPGKKLLCFPHVLTSRRLIFWSGLWHGLSSLQRFTDSQKLLMNPRPCHRIGLAFAIIPACYISHHRSKLNHFASALLQAIHPCFVLEVFQQPQVSACDAEGPCQFLQLFPLGQENRSVGTGKGQERLLLLRVAVCPQQFFCSLLYSLGLRITDG